ncbi:MAG: molybdenum cofactor guanylyltransferase [Chloroflexota bacterium]|nr:molybdenum cofactor guanylyltransferase [Chloroflexota bacterium]
MDVVRPDPTLSGVILAGGKSTRLGRDKILVELEGQPLIARILDVLAQLTGDLIVVTSMAPRLFPPSVRVVADRYVGAGVLAGVHAGLLAARKELALVVACDMPFLNLDLLRHVIALAYDADIVVPRWTDVEPLHAIYRPATCLEPIERALARGERRIISFYDGLRVRYVERDEIAQFDPQGLSFFNVNSPKDWQRASSLARCWQQG